MTSIELPGEKDEKAELALSVKVALKDFCLALEGFANQIAGYNYGDTEKMDEARDKIIDALEGEEEVGKEEINAANNVLPGYYSFLCQKTITENGRSRSLILVDQQRLLTPKLNLVKKWITDNTSPETKLELALEKKKEERKKKDSK